MNAVSKIVSLHGQAIPEPGKPEPDVVERLEWLLKVAKDGEIKGVSAAFAWNDDSVGTIRAGWQSYTMVGRVADLQYRMLSELKDK